MTPVHAAENAEALTNTREMAFYTQKTQSQKQMKHNNENLIDWSPRPSQVNVCTQKLFILEHSISRN